MASRQAKGADRPCSGRGCPERVPVSRAGYLCRDCSRTYTRAWRAKQRELLPPDTDTYCGTCGCPVNPEAPCCAGALVVPAIPWSLWRSEQIEIGLTLKWNNGVLTARKLLLKVGGSRDRLFRCGSELGSPDGALISPYLYTVNALGMICFLTPRALAGDY